MCTQECIKVYEVYPECMKMYDSVAMKVYSSRTFVRTWGPFEDLRTLFFIVSL